MLWFDPSQHSSTDAATCSLRTPSPPQDGEENRETKPNKTHGLRCRLNTKGRKTKLRKGNCSLTTSHQQTNTQTMPEKLPPWKTTHHLLLPPPQFIASAGASWDGITLWAIQFSCPGCLPSQPLAHPSWVRNRGGLDTVQMLFSNSQTPALEC